MGERHIFVRFEECHIRCSYCDELGKGGRDWSRDEVVAEVMRLAEHEGQPAFVSFTGGEPLLYVEFVEPLMRRLKVENFRLYLETDGILWRALRRVVDLCDCIAMDMKPASVTGEGNFDRDHARFLEIARRKETLVKIVISKDLKRDEFRAHMDIVRKVAPKTPVVLQPVSNGIEGHEDAELMELLNQLMRDEAARDLNVRLLPRLHRILQIP